MKYHVSWTLGYAAKIKRQFFPNMTIFSCMFSTCLQFFRGCVCPACLGKGWGRVHLSPPLCVVTAVSKDQAFIYYGLTQIRTRHEPDMAYGQDTTWVRDADTTWTGEWIISQINRAQIRWRHVKCKMQNTIYFYQITSKRGDPLQMQTRAPVLYQKMRFFTKGCQLHSSGPFYTLYLLIQQKPKGMSIVTKHVCHLQYPQIYLS